MNITKFAIALLLISVVAAKFAPNLCTLETLDKIKEVEKNCSENANKIMWSCDKERAQQKCLESGNSLKGNNFMKCG